MMRIPISFSNRLYIVLDEVIKHLRIAYQKSEKYILFDVKLAPQFRKAIIHKKLESVNYY